MRARENRDENASRESIATGRARGEWKAVQRARVAAVGIYTAVCLTNRTTTSLARLAEAAAVYRAAFHPRLQYSETVSRYTLRTYYYYYYTRHNNTYTHYAVPGPSPHPSPQQPMPADPVALALDIDKFLAR